VNRWTDSNWVAVDWGSTARRAYLLDPSGAVVDEMEDEAGTLATPRERFPAEVGALRTRFGSVPLLMAGMVGSNRGWVETPYLPCPATVDALAGRIVRPEPGRTGIVPGLSLIEGDRADVMRGEEVQVFGLLALEREHGDAVICHPGTHTKWVWTHRILADLLAGGAAVPGPAFDRGVERGLAGAAIGAELFGLRAGVLLDRIDRADAPSLVSGLLIGADLRAGLAEVEPGREIAVLGRGSLTALYAAALRASGRGAREQDGAQAFIAGMRALAETMT
jgi:2-dehydro-3-deoxygalactonokinase